MQWKSLKDMETQNKNLTRKLVSLLGSSNSGIRVMSLLDQIFFSAANFILTLTLAKYYSSYEVAGYGIGLSIALIIESTQRNTYIVQNSLLSPSIFRRRTSKVMGQHLIIWGIIISLELIIFALLSLFYSSPNIMVIFYSTLVCSLIYAQLTFDRICLLKHKRYKDPLIISAAFFLLCLTMFFVVPYWHIDYSVVMLLVGSYAIIKIIRLVMLLGTPDLFWGWRLVKRDFRKYFFGSILGVIGSSGFSHVPLFILGAVAAPIHAAAFVALRGLTQPLTMVIKSLDVIDKNLSTAKAGGSKQVLRQIFWRQFSIYGGLALLAILGTVIAGEFILELVYGDKYVEFSSILLGWILVFSVMTITFPIETIIVKQGKLVQYNIWRLFSGGISVALAFYLCSYLSWGANGAIIACLVGWVISVIFALYLIRDAIFEIKPK